jgi:hypothetical protein
MARRRAVNANVVMAALRWLDRTPESFIDGHADASSQPHLPADLPSGFYRMWNLAELLRAIDLRRGRRPWTEIGREIRVPTTLLRGLTSAERFVSFPEIMRITQWLNRPLPDFIIRTTDA